MGAWEVLAQDSEVPAIHAALMPSGEVVYYSGNEGVPAEAREGLLKVCRQRLSKNGIAFVSYNAYPGRYPRRMLREILVPRRQQFGDDAHHRGDRIKDNQSV